MERNKRIFQIEAFIRKSVNEMEVKVSHKEDSAHAYAALMNAISKRKYYSDMVRVETRKGKIYLVRLEGKRVDES